MATTPRSNKQRAAASVAEVLGSNLGDEVPSEFRIEMDTSDAKGASRKAVDKEERIWIILEDQDDMPPGGVFLSANGKGYKLLPGVEAYVPKCLTHILDCAVLSSPVLDEVTRQVIRYRDRLRYPYRVLHNKPAPELAA